MSTREQVYKCNVCGHIVSVAHAAAGTLVCCGQEMGLLVENSTDAAQEKHVPQVQKTDSGYTVVVGSVNHPMEEKHHIEWIEVLADDRLYRKYLKPGQKPVVEFEIKSETLSARAYCNLHGLWRSE
jgi:superoxide reductase